MSENIHSFHVVTLELRLFGVFSPYPCYQQNSSGFEFGPWCDLCGWHVLTKGEQVPDIRTPLLLLAGGGVLAVECLLVPLALPLAQRKSAAVIDGESPQPEVKLCGLGLLAFCE